MTIDRRRLMATLAALPFATIAGSALAQEVEIRRRGLTFRLNNGDKRWLKRYCEGRGFTEGTPQYQDCYETRAREILEQRARDTFYRPDV